MKDVGAFYVIRESTGYSKKQFLISLAQKATSIDKLWRMWTIFMLSGNLQVTVRSKLIKEWLTIIDHF